MLSFSLWRNCLIIATLLQLGVVLLARKFRPFLVFCTLKTDCLTLKKSTQAFDHSSNQVWVFPWLTSCCKSYNEALSSIMLAGAYYIVFFLFLPQTHLYLPCILTTFRIVYTVFLHFYFFQNVLPFLFLFLFRSFSNNSYLITFCIYHCLVIDFGLSFIHFIVASITMV